MHNVVRKLSLSVEAPLVIDTTELEVIEAGLKACSWTQYDQFGKPGIG